MLDRMAPLGATLCVIDTAPHSGGDAFTVATLADHILIPVQPSAPDLRAIHQTIKIAESAGTPATVVINRAIVNQPTIAQSHRTLAANVAIVPRHDASTHRAQPRLQLRPLRRRDRAGHEGRRRRRARPAPRWLVSARALPQADTKETA